MIFVNAFATFFLESQCLQLFNYCNFINIICSIFWWFKEENEPLDEYILIMSTTVAFSADTYIKRAKIAASCYLQSQNASMENAQLAQFPCSYVLWKHFSFAVLPTAMGKWKPFLRTTFFCIYYAIPALVYIIKW